MSFPRRRWFDRPFDRLTVLSEVEGLTTLSTVEGEFRKYRPLITRETEHA